MLPFDAMPAFDLVWLVYFALIAAAVVYFAGLRRRRHRKGPDGAPPAA